MQVPQYETPENEEGKYINSRTLLEADSPTQSWNDLNAKFNKVRGFSEILGFDIHELANFLNDPDTNTYHLQQVRFNLESIQECLTYHKNNTRKSRIENEIKSIHQDLELILEKNEESQQLIDSCNEEDQQVKQPLIESKIYSQRGSCISDSNNSRGSQLRLLKRSSSIFRMTVEKVQYETVEQPHVLIIYKMYDPECIPIVQTMVEILLQLKWNVYLDANGYSNVTNQNQVQKFNPDDQQVPIQLLITIGGDGTILHSLKFFQATAPMILSFEKGTLGFLCVFSLEGMEEVLTQVSQKFSKGEQFVVESKLRLQGVLTDDRNQELLRYQALNEFVITRGTNSQCLYLEIYINDKLLTVAAGDGLIISTPTGSTAYFLSAGGPIVQNEVKSIGIAPICPLSLSFRPIVLPACMEIKIKLSPQNRAFGFICCDGQVTKEFHKDMVLTIKNMNSDVKLIQQVEDIDYTFWVQSLRKKLSWNKVFTDTKKKSKL
ncbi:hypothetical protein pb186bvf_018175 [Paramecium bursaria]